MDDQRCTRDCGCLGESMASECQEEPWCAVCEAWAFDQEADLGSEVSGGKEGSGAPAADALDV